MKEYYIIRVGNMYLRDLYLCEDKVENEFIHSFELHAENGKVFTKSEAECMCNKLYIVSGLKGEVVEVNEND